jgi:hypothetical protein
MAGNAQIPRQATQVDIEVGYMPDGTLVEVSLFRHTPAGHTAPKYWFVRLCRNARGRIDMDTRVTFQVSGKNATATAEREMAQVRTDLLASRATCKEGPTLRRVGMAAGRFLAETPEGEEHPEPTDEEIAKRMADTIKPITSRLYPAVRREIAWILTGE